MERETDNTGVLRTLRALVPRRPLSYDEALKVAELQANRLLGAFRVDEPGTDDALAVSLPFIEVVLRDDLPTSGGALWVKSRWLLLINGQEPMVRNRFSLFHELHHILNSPFDRFTDPSLSVEQWQARQERLADFFAACVLMPRRIVKRRWGQGQQEPDGLAEEFGVSVEAMRYRLDQLGLTERRPRCTGPETLKTLSHGVSPVMNQAA